MTTFRQSGFIVQLWKKWMTSADSCLDDALKTQKIALWDLAGLYVVIASSFVFGFGALIIELLIRRFRTSP